MNGPGGGPTGGTNEHEPGETTLEGEILTSGGPLVTDGESLIDNFNGGGGEMSMLLGPGDPVWVDFGSGGAKDGTEQNPFNTFLEGLYVASWFGSDSILIDRQTPIYRSGETGTFAPLTPVRIEAVNGPVRIGEATARLFTYFTGIGAVVYEPMGESLSGLSYAINPESRTFPKDAAITVKAYPAEGYKFDGRWFPEDQTQPASPEDLLPAGIHLFTLEHDRLLWPVFTKNETNLDVADPDGDGLANFRETDLGTNPNSADSDGDTLPDWWEVNYDLDPLNIQGVDGAIGNPDDDEWINSAEYGLASSPIEHVANATNSGRVLGRINLIAANQQFPSREFYLIERIPEPITLEFSSGSHSVPSILATYTPGSTVTWRFRPTPAYSDWQVDHWQVTSPLHPNGLTVYDNEVTFVAQSSCPTCTMQVILFLRPIVPAEAELEYIRVSAPGPYGNAFFEGGFTEWGTPDGTPLKRKMDAENHPDRRDYPRAAEVYFDAVRTRTINGDVPGRSQ